jgi:hypothetical protein
VDDQMVVSVGPYMLVMVAPWRRPARAPALSGSASPPIIMLLQPRERAARLVVGDQHARHRRRALQVRDADGAHQLRREREVVRATACTSSLDTRRS